MTEPAYPAARAVAATVAEHFSHYIAIARRQGQLEIAPGPDAQAVEAIIDATFWASLRREEGYTPKISLAFIPPELAGQPLTFDQPLPLDPSVLSRVAPTVERPGIHLGVWRQSDELCVWGITRTIPRFSMVLEVIEPGLLVVKYRRGQDPGKFNNIVVLEGDQIKLVDEMGTGLPDCPDLVTSMLGFASPFSPVDSFNVLVQLAVSMRTHGRGGALLVVPHASEAWLESIVRPMPYLVSPPYSELASLMRQETHAGRRKLQESLSHAIETIGGLTAVDGAAIAQRRLASRPDFVECRQQGVVVAPDPGGGQPFRNQPIGVDGGLVDEPTRQRSQSCRRAASGGLHDGILDNSLVRQR